MAKKLLITLLTGVVLLGLGFALASCGKTEEFDIIMITDAGGIDDRGFNQSTWEAIEKFKNEKAKDVRIKYIKPNAANQPSYDSAIDEAARSKAQVIVTPGFLFDASIRAKSKEYPNIKFIFIDGTIVVDTKNPENSIEKYPNVVNYTYKEEDAGYFAGYGLVVDGVKSFGFYGGMSVPAVVKFGQGYLNGINAAIKDLNLKSEDFSAKYIYSGGFAPDPKIVSNSSNWLDQGVEAIFACGGGLYLSVVEAMKQKDKGILVGVDIDQSHLSNRVRTSATKDITNSVIEALDAWKANTWATKGGKHIVGNGEIPTKDSSWKFTKFTKEQYEALKTKVYSDPTLNVVSHDAKVRVNVSFNVDYQK